MMAVKSSKVENGISLWMFLNFFFPAIFIVPAYIQDRKDAQYVFKAAKNKYPTLLKICADRGFTRASLSSG